MRQPRETGERAHRPRGVLRLPAVVVAATAAGVALATRKLPGDRRRRARPGGFAAGASAPTAWS